MNNNNKRSITDRIAAFVGGKGFYIVLFLCVAVIGVSAWTLNLTIRDAGLDLESPIDNMPAITVPAPPVTVAPIQPRPSAIVPPRATPGVASATPPPTAVPTPVATPKPSQTPAAAEQQQPAQPAMSKLPDTFIWPVSGSVAQVFAMDRVVYDRTMRDWRVHRGVDVEGVLGGAVQCVAAGVVVSVTTEPLYGTSVRVEHGGGLESVYRNLEAEPPVGEGQELAMGDVIGTIGQSASAEIGDVAHVHFEMYLDGTLVDPAEYLPNR